MKKIFLGKKGEEHAQKMVFYVIAILLITAMCFILIYIFNYDLTTESMIPKNMERNLFIQRFLNSEDCFAYKDSEIQRIYPYVLDKNKLTQEQFDDCFKGENSRISFRIKFIGAGVPNLELKTANWVDGKSSEREAPINIKVIDEKREINEAKMIIEVQEEESVVAEIKTNIETSVGK